MRNINLVALLVLLVTNWESTAQLPDRPPTPGLTPEVCDMFNKEYIGNLVELKTNGLNESQIELAISVLPDNMRNAGYASEAGVIENIVKGAILMLFNNESSFLTLYEDNFFYNSCLGR